MVKHWKRYRLYSPFCTDDQWSSSQALRLFELNIAERNKAMVRVSRMYCRRNQEDLGIYVRFPSKQESDVCPGFLIWTWSGLADELKIAAEEEMG
jgi:hypothetical protein